MKKTCDTCGGSGQTGHFQGVSRFVITWEDCTECLGTGFIDTAETTDETSKSNDKEEDKAGEK